jgi:hypothetical protein
MMTKPSKYSVIFFLVCNLTVLGQAQDNEPLSEPTTKSSVPMFVKFSSTLPEDSLCMANRPEELFFGPKRKPLSPTRTVMSQSC